jgi:hypothetical protein
MSPTFNGNSFPITSGHVIFYPRQTSLALKANSLQPGFIWAKLGVNTFNYFNFIYSAELHERQFHKGAFAWVIGIFIDILPCG